MRAPTHITGPDGTRCRQGEEIPEQWFDDLPDLRDHLANLVGGGDPSADPGGETTEVHAAAKIQRRRNQS